MFCLLFLLYMFAMVVELKTMVTPVPTLTEEDIRSTVVGLQVPRWCVCDCGW